MVQVPFNQRTGWICSGITIALLLAVSIIILYVKTSAVATEKLRQGSAAGGGSKLMARSCAEARVMDPTLPSGDYYVDPDGVNIGDDPISVYCDMKTGATLVGHDIEMTIDVGNCNAAGCYSRSINYAGGATTRQLTALVDLSASCRQSIRYDCFSAPLRFGGVQESWWNDRNGAERYFWAGGYTNSNQHTCQCGIDKTCIDPNAKCNCDTMETLQLNDTGFVTDKNALPVTRLNFGRIAPGANGKHTLGKFECSGRKILATKPTNCHDLFIAGNQISGFYTVKGSATQLKTVYCDYTKAPDAAGYETVIGFNDVKTAGGVSFFVQRSTTYSFPPTVIPYDLTRLNIGSAMNTATGVFTAPKNGRYHFSFTARSGTDGQTWVQLRLNRVDIGWSRATSRDNNLPIVATLHLKTGDKVDTYLATGSLFDGNDHITQFSGFLLEEDLVL